MLFFFNDTATTEIYTLSLHDALPIWEGPRDRPAGPRPDPGPSREPAHRPDALTPSPGESCQRAAGSCALLDRKSTRLNSSHANISYAVFCLKKKKNLLHHPVPESDGP